MKKYLSLLLIMFVFGASFTSKKKDTCFWLVYDGSGDQNEFSNYDIQTSSPGACPGSDLLCWIAICQQDNTLSQQDFEDGFELLDTNWDILDSMTDEVEKIVYAGSNSYTLEKKASELP